jgi:predicted DCC family thiol-disulfide oxidoreductase YuxK
VVHDTWTGGQYSIYRALLGAFLVVHFAMLLPYGAEVFAAGGLVADATMSPYFGVVPNPLAAVDGPAAVGLLLVLGLVAGIAVTVGLGDRAGAITAAFVLAWLYQRNPLIANPSLPLLGWLLVLHVFVPIRPYGSLAARRSGGADPAWRLPAYLHAAAWVVLALAYTHSGWTKLASPSWLSGDAIRYVLENPLARDHALREFALATPRCVLAIATWTLLLVELLFAPLALRRSLRPWLWSAMLFAQLGFLTFLDFADLTAPMLLAHLLTFDPRWLARFRERSSAIIFFDGNCAFCHASVGLAAHEDAHGQLQFAPLEGSTAAASGLPLGAAQRRDSIVVVAADGSVSTRSRAVAELLARLGGLWLIGASLLRATPRVLADAAYDAVGRVRIRLGGRYDEQCALVPVAVTRRLLP